MKENKDIQRELGRIRRIENAENLKQFGVRGHIFIQSGETVSGDYFYIEAWNSDPIVSYTVLVDCEPVEYNFIEIQDGRWILGEFTSLSVHSGQIIAYKK